MCLLYLFAGQIYKYNQFFFILLFLYVALMIDIFLQSKIIALFRRHGAVEVVTPLLSPYVKTAKNNAVRLMSHSGSVVVLPHDLRVPFIKHAALSGINVIRRYSVGRVYCEKNTQFRGFHVWRSYFREWISIIFSCSHEICIYSQKFIFNKW